MIIYILLFFLDRTNDVSCKSRKHSLCGYCLAPLGRQKRITLTWENARARENSPSIFLCTLHYVRTDVRMDKDIFQWKYCFRYGPSKQDYYAQISQMKVNDLHPIGFGQWQKSHLELLWCLRARFFNFWKTQFSAVKGL